MFAEGDVCQQSLGALEDVTSLSHKSVQRVLSALLAAGFIVKEETGQGRGANRYRLLLTAGNGA
jgi:predicted transcriptional regulator